MTYIGPEYRPIPGLLLSSFYQLPSLDIFKSHHRFDITDNNENIVRLWQITVLPEQLRDFILTVKYLDSIQQIEKRNGYEPHVSFLLSVADADSAHRPILYEALLTIEEATTILHSVASDLRHDHPAAAKYNAISESCVGRHDHCHTADFGAYFELA